MTTATVSAAPGWNYTEAALVEELAKCDLLCISCHNEITWEQRR